MQSTWLILGIGSYSPKLEFKQTYADGRIAPTLRVVDHWVEMIQQGQTTAPSLREGVYSQLLMDLAHQSHQMGTWVDIPDLDDFLSDRDRLPSLSSHP